jgi:sulfotransferase
MDNGIHFISGLPRSGSTLLAAILRQNPKLHAGMTSPVAYLCGQLLAALRADTEWSVLVDGEQRKNILSAVVNAYYHDIHLQKVVFDTNRAWCSRMPALARLFPRSRVIACVRDLAWIFDSFERVVRKNPLLMSRLFKPDQSTTVYNRVEALNSPAGPVGFAWNALREAYYGEHARQVIFVDYEALTQEPQRTIDTLYDLLNLPRFDHDFDNVTYEDGHEFDARIGVPELHLVARSVRFVERPTILPPDIFQRFSNRCFWRGQQSNPRDVRILMPEKLSTECQSDVRAATSAILRHKGNVVVMGSGVG